MQIKAQPKDFVVKEHKAIEKSKEGDYSYWLLKKRNLTTSEAVKQLAQKLHISKIHEQTYLLGNLLMQHQRYLTRHLLYQ